MLSQIGYRGGIIMTEMECEAVVLESRLADLKHQFEDAAAPLMTRLKQIHEPRDTDKILLIPRQAQRRSPGVRLPRHF